MIQNQILQLAIGYNSGDIKRIEHLVKVYAYAEWIGLQEQLPAQDMQVLRAAAALHDIGIHNAQRKYGSAAGKYQELEGPPVARELLSGMDAAFVAEVCNLISRHHTYTGVDKMTLRILMEADFIVNAAEEGLSAEAIRSGEEKIFATTGGKMLLHSVFCI